MYIFKRNCQLRDNSPRGYEAFKKGYHVIRRSDRYCAGLSTDLVIKQVLMSSVKQLVEWLAEKECLNTSVLNGCFQCLIVQRWTPLCKHFVELISILAHNIKILVNQEWREITKAHRHPFCEGTLLWNIEIGITSVYSVNAYKAVEIGSNILQAMIGKNIFDYSFKKSSQAVTPTTTQTVTLDGETVHVDPQLLFQRLTAAAQWSAEDIPQVFTYELCSVPSSLFDTAGFIREPQKPALADAIWGLGDCSCAEPFRDDRTCTWRWLFITTYTLIMSQENIMMLSLFLWL